MTMLVERSRYQEIISSTVLDVMMPPFFLRSLAACIIVAGAATAQQNDSSFRFNLFDFEGVYVQTIFNFDEGYSEKTGILVATPFSISVPKRGDVTRIADGKPDGGAFVKFTFAVKGEASADGDEPGLVLLENLQIITANIPLSTDAEDPRVARLRAAANLLRERVYPQAVAGFENAEILAVEEYQFSNYQGVQLIGRYIDSTIGPMMLRLTANLNPNEGASYVTIANINLTLAPVTGGETLMQTITARTVNSLVYK